MEASAPTPSSFRVALGRQALAHPLTSLALALAMLAIIVLMISSVWDLVRATGDGMPAWGLLGGGAGFVATSLGALGAVVLRRLSTLAEDSMLGFAAGMMLAASSFSLILPGLEAAGRLTGNDWLGALTVVLGLGLGAALMMGLDTLTPHAHPQTGPCGAAPERLNRVWLFVMAITLHNLPEGMAIGVSFAGGDLGVGLPLTSAIAIQDIPEGLAVAMALRSAGIGVFKAALLAGATGLMEPAGALVGLGLSSGLAIAYPVGLGLAAGAMLFVVSHEVIPETHRNGHQTPATLGLMLGFALMMVLDTVLG
ncbi:ZIP family metal transporter [Pararhodospirillum oryzae]|uniref:ZIP family metal transporter n=1 Tax=Pararhodospirillum oryzae TaxID=478448 RepID=A0A512H393_9PROT|nr:ZIP family metal transporter [Pararhodospirillum oryzae]GEO79932.1 ZIP family metal transporter [Pararhodospirillum oryzae]